jgi:hypothetical protein
MSDLAELEREQAEAAKFALKMVEEKDPERLKEMAEQLQERCKDLEKMAKGMEAAWAPEGSEGGETHVVLTKEQRERIAEQTGVGIEVVTLMDTPERKWAQQMPTAEPHLIEKMAAKQAAQSRLIQETRTQVEKIIKQLEALNVPEIADQIAELKRDPTLGLASKK